MSDIVKGALANSSGRILEQNVIAILERKGFEVLYFRDYLKNPKNHGEELLLRNIPFRNIYGQPSNTEFLLKSKKYDMEIRIECKWQQSAGSVDEKFPYLYLNCIECMPEKNIFIIADGDGARAGAINWIKFATENKLYRSDKNIDKKITVMDLKDFIIWANKTLR